MSSQESAKTEERKARLAKTDHWNELFALRDRQREQRKNGLQVITEEGLPLENNRQGLMRWYMHPAITDTALTTLLVFQQDISPGGRSGRMKFQGGQVMFIIEGKGYTTVDGVKHHWEAGDIVNLPLRMNGVVIQHFNSDDAKAARFIAAEPNWFACTSVDRGSGFEQIEDSPDYREP